MSLLDRFPHRCTILAKTRSKGSLGGIKDSTSSVSTGVVCWEQQASNREREEFEKKGYTNVHKIYFLSDPSVNERNLIQITSRDQGTTTISSPDDLNVLSESLPDASAGLGRVYKVMTGQISQERV